MGMGINLAREEAPEHAAILDDFKDQLLIALLKRQADKDGKVNIPIEEVDATGGFIVAFAITNNTFNFEVRKKQ